MSSNAQPHRVPSTIFAQRPNHAVNTDTHRRRYAPWGGRRLPWYVSRHDAVTRYSVFIRGGTRCARIACVLTLCCVLSGCVFLVSDLALRDVSISDSSASDNRDLLGNPVGVGLLRVDLVSESNLMKMARQGELNVGTEASICPEGQTESPVETVSSVYFHEFRVDGLSTATARRNEGLAAERYPGPPFIYHVFVFPDGPRRRNIDPTKPDQPSYSLVAMPRTLCLRLRGGAMWGLAGWRRTLL